MIRYVHHEFRMAIAAWFALIVTAGVAFGVRGPSTLREDWWDVLGIVTGVLVLFCALRATRIPVLGLVPELETAPLRRVPYDHWSTDRWTLLQPQMRKSTVIGALAPVAVLLPVSLLWEPYVVVGLVYWAVDPSVRGSVAARHERRYGVLLWLGRKGRDPSEYYYTPVSPGPPPRTATDAPPG